MMLSSTLLLLVVPAGALIASPLRLLSPAAAATVRATVAASAGSGKFTEITPLKAAMLCKMWQGLLTEVDQKVGVVPELGLDFEGVMTMQTDLFQQTAERAGATIRLD